MRVCGLLCFAIVVVGMSAAQDSNFAVGPQYLMNYGSPMFMRSIATPTVSLGEAPAATSPAVSVPETPVSSTTPVQADLTRVYWGARDTGEATSETASVIEISGTTPLNLPGSIVNVGVQETVDAQSLRERGYGVTVSEASAYWKTHKPRTVKVFTNRDVERLHGE